MDMITILLIAIGLAMDCFAVSIASGVTIKDLKVQNALKIATFFGTFQALMAFIGWLAASSFADLISGIDHWIAFILLAIIGGKMIYESLKKESEKKQFDPLNLHVLLILSIATSIDSLAVGVSFAFLNIYIIAPIIIIGIASFAFSIFGTYLGNRIGEYFKNKVEFLGGIILIGIGLKVLIEHLYF
jgi:putative Mn2+ efflux pump MntP